MKTIQEVKDRIQFLSDDALSLRKKIDYTRKDKKIVKSHLKEIAFLRNAILYLETSPRQEFVSGEIRRLETLIESIKNRANPAFTKKALNAFLKEAGVNKYKEQLRTLKFIK